MKTFKMNLSRFSIVALALCLMLSMLAINVQAESAEPVSDPSPAVYVAAKNMNSVVGVLTYADQWTRRSGVESTNISQGSGVVIREGGYILTNNHVIEDGSSFKVLMPSGEKVEATLVGADSALDLAVLKVDADTAAQLTPVEIGATGDLLVGSTVVAIGNPGGEVLANSVTQGIVSALERNNVEARNTTRTVAYIQHDAAINSGNSGGGLFNYKGQLVGINTLKYSGSLYSTVSFEGLGFAIPVETAVKISSDLIEFGKVIRPALGVQVSEVEGPDEPLNGYPPASVCIEKVTEGGAAEAAGLKDYDFIYAINGNRVTTMRELTSQLDLHEPGDVVEVTVIRYQNAQRVPVQSANNSYYYFFGGGQSESSRTELTVSGGFEEVTVQVTLETLK